MAARVQRNPTPRCNRRPCRGVQDRADFMGKLVPFIVFVLSRGAAERYPLGCVWLVNKFDGGVIR